MAIQVEDATVDIGSLHRGVAIEGNSSRSAVESPGSKVGARCRDGTIAQVVGKRGESAATIEESAGVEGPNSVITTERPGSTILQVESGRVAVDPVGASADKSCSGTDVDCAVRIRQEAVEGQGSRLDIKSAYINSGVVRSRGCVVGCSADQNVAVARQLGVFSAEVLEIGSVERDMAIHQVDRTLSHDEGA